VELQGGDGKHLDLAGVAVSVSLAPAGGTLSGTLTRTTDGHGRARFDDLAITGAPGVYTLQFSADGFTPATSDSITLSSPPEGTTVTAR
jgi:alkyl hydroperoxide reductase subunit AhpF